MKSVDHFFNYLWYSKKNWLSILLIPFSFIFRTIVFIRYFCYQKNIFKSYRPQVPVIVVGNITVGGTGKTPIVMSLVKALQARGLQPGVISRGYRGSSTQTKIVLASDPASLVGDEPLLLAKNLSCPVVMGKSRVEAVKFLVAHHDCTIVISDDGLQHYALQRDLELVVVDGTRRYGNEYCLPAGPLREPLSRLKSVDMILVNGGGIGNEISCPAVFTGSVISVSQDNKKSLADFKQRRVHAVAGVGNPGRFFEMLSAFGIDVVPHPFPDHHHFQKSDFIFLEPLPILMTEKDAVKCADFNLENAWAVPIEVVLPQRVVGAVLKEINL